MQSASFWSNWTDNGLCANHGDVLIRGELILHMFDELQVSTHDCTAHSAVYTPGTNKIRPLFIFTDTWCSSGQFRADGTLVQTGGDADGNSKVKYLMNIDRADPLSFGIQLAKARSW